MYREGLEKILPFLTWRKMVNKGTLRSDVIAGIIGAIIVFPQGIAFATIAGLPPQYGLYAAIVPAIVAALWGSSWHLVSGPTTAISLVTFASLAPLADPGSDEYVVLAITLAAMVGLFQFLLGVFRFGTLVRLISPTVVVGFTAGAGFLIATSQLKNAFGLPVPAGSSFYETWKFVLVHITDSDPFILAIVIVTLGVGIVMRKYFRKFPYMIPAILVGSLTAYGLNQHFGTAVTGIKTIGALPVSLPPLSMPLFNTGTLHELPLVALAITLLGLTEAVAISRSVANRSKQRIDGNQEFIGQGLSNIVGSFFSAYPSSGSFNRSGLNYEAGAKTPLASVFAALFLMVLILVLSPLAAYMPYAVMAAILFLVAYGIIDIPHIKYILKSDKQESALLIITFFATLFIDLEEAIFIGVVLSLAFFLRRVMFAEVTEVGESKDHQWLAPLDEAHDAERVSGVLMVRIDMSMVYMNCEAIMENITTLLAEREREEGRPVHTLVLNCSGINYIDIAGLDIWETLVADMKEKHVHLGITGAKQKVRKALEDNGLWEAFTYYKNIEELRDGVLCQVIKNESKVVRGK